MTDATRLGKYLVVTGIVLALGTVAVAAVVDLGTGPTTTRAYIEDLHRSLLLVAVPIAVLVEAVLLYAIWRFANNDDPTPTPENRKLELAWTLATALVLVFVGVASYQVLAQPDVTAAAAGPDAPEDALQVEMTAHQWYWSVEYPEQNASMGPADPIVLPADTTIRIGITSADVIHSFHAPRLGLKQDAIPGQRNVLVTRITEPGEYRLYCAEYCGQGHAYMQATIEVVPPEEFPRRVAEVTNQSATGGVGPGGTPAG